jgi:hypothetical protein
MARRRERKLSGVSKQELLEELARREAEENPSEMSFMELEQAVERFKFEVGLPALKERLGRMKSETTKPKPCPKCGKRVRVKARDRERTLKTLSGEVTFKRNYYHCESCQHGFYPVDEMLGLSAEGDVSPEMEKRVMDLAVNGPFGQGAERFSVHYPFCISDNLLRGSTDRVGEMLEESNGLYLQLELKALPKTAAEVLYVETDGCLLPMRGEEPWKEAKGAVLFRSDCHHASSPQKPRGEISEARYVASLGGQEEFDKQLSPALKAERAKAAKKVAWLGDGAPSNWSAAQRHVPGCIEILDWGHAREHGKKFGKVVLGEESPWLPLWEKRLEELLYEGDNDVLVRELMDCLGEDISDKGIDELDKLVDYYRTNAKRMRYREFRQQGLLIGSGVVESSHRHVLQARMKLAGQHWSLPKAKKMARLRAAYRTAGPLRFYEAIRRAHWRTQTDPRIQPAKVRRRASNR